MNEADREAWYAFKRAHPTAAAALTEPDKWRERRARLVSWLREMPFWSGVLLVAVYAVSWLDKIIIDIDMHGPHVLAALLVGTFCGWLMMASIRQLFHREGWIDEYERDEKQVTDPAAKLLPHAVMTLAVVLGFVVPFAAVLAFWDQ